MPRAPIMLQCGNARESGSRDDRSGGGLPNPWAAGPRDKPSLYKAGGEAEDRGAMEIRDGILKTEVLIAGGGMVGMATAAALGEAGIACVLVDPESGAERISAGYDGRASAIAYGSQQALTSLGLWWGMAAAAEPILGIRVSDGRVGSEAAPLFLPYDYPESGLDEAFCAIVAKR